MGNLLEINLKIREKLKTNEDNNIDFKWYLVCNPEFILVEIFEKDTDDKNIQQ